MPTTTQFQLNLFGHDEVVREQSKRTLNHKPIRFGTAAVDYITSRQILTKATGFMSSYDFTLNPYSGCSFGCSYCYAAFFNYDVSKKQSWGEWVTVKENAVALMQKYREGFLNGKRIYMSSVTDPYQPIESRLEITRELLDVLSMNHEPKLVVQTRSPSVSRDIDLFHRIEENGGRVQVNMTITTDDDSIRRAFEPSCPSSTKRLDAISQIRASGIDACITLTPLLLIDNRRHFVNQLIDTGVHKFIIQPFHFRKGSFVAGTRDNALNLLAEKLGCEKKSIASSYNEIYQDFLQYMKAALRQKAIPTPGEGKHGFSPPF